MEIVLKPAVATEAVMTMGTHCKTMEVVTVQIQAVDLFGLVQTAYLSAQEADIDQLHTGAIVV